MAVTRTFCFLTILTILLFALGSLIGCSFDDDDDDDDDDPEETFT